MVLVMHQFGDVAEAAVTWPHNAAGSQDFVGVTEPAPESGNREEAYFGRYVALDAECQKRTVGMPIAYLDNDAVHFRRKVPLAPALGEACIGVVRTVNPLIPYNCGALYLRAGDEARRFLARILFHKDECLKIRDGHADEHAFARAMLDMPGAVAVLDPAWNNWLKATGERLRPAVVQAFHAMKGASRLAAVQASVALSVEKDL